jgi:hypothetical protein
MMDVELDERIAFRVEKVHGAANAGVEAMDGA